MCASPHHPSAARREAAVREIRSALAEAARGRGTLTYGELCHRLVAVRLLPRSHALIRLLAEACDDEGWSRGQDMASLVVRASDGMPGEGYFAWAEREGLGSADREAWWRARVEGVWDAFTEEGP